VFAVSFFSIYFGASVTTLQRSRKLLYMLVMEESFLLFLIGKSDTQERKCLFTIAHAILQILAVEKHRFIFYFR
jgi:hypothetical protein